jgi:hypothetical protein
MINMAAKIFLALVVLLTIASAASAQQQTIAPEKKALIKELLDVTGEPKTSEAMLNEMLKSIDKELPERLEDALKKDTNLSPQSKEELRKSLKEDLAKMTTRYTTLILEKIDLPKLIETTIYPLYDKFFTEKEIIDLIAFYKTDTGKKIIAVSPELGAESLRVTIKYVMPIMDDIGKQMRLEMEQFVKEKSNDLKSKRSRRGTL